MNDTPTKSEPEIVTLMFEFESDGRLTVRSWADSGLRISGEPAAVFRDLGPEIARVLLAKEEPSFTTMLRERMRDPSDPESINFRIAGIDPTGIGVATYEEFKARTLAFVRGESVELGKRKMWFTSIEAAENFIRQAETDLAELRASKAKE
jgi:hypothetical protein